jgi:hypothetical protein
MFGYALMAAGVLRVIEVCFVLNDQPTPMGTLRVFQHLPPYLLVLGGTLFMSATDEEMHNADALGIDHVSYALFDFSLSFIIYLLITFLVHLYSTSGRNANRSIEEPGATEAGYAKLNQQAAAAHDADADADGGPESYELTEHASLSGESDAVKIHGEDEVDWINRDRSGGVRL